MGILAINETIDELVYKVLVYELSSCGFEFCCSHLNFRYCANFEQRVP